MVKDVPSENEALRLTKKLLPQLGINLSDIEKEAHSLEPNFHVSDMGVTYFVNHKAITNTEARVVCFGRAVDGISFVSIGTGGDGEIHFGGHSHIIRMLITWRNLERYKAYPTFDPEMIVKSIRDGKAIQGMVPDSVGSIDWKMVKSVTIKKAKPCYYAGGDRFAPSDWLQPYAALWASVETDHGDVDVEIDCPIINEPKLPDEAK